MSDFAIKNGDLVLNDGSKDFAIEEDDNVAFLPQVMDAMEMQIADDIDYPAYYSKQRQFHNAEANSDSELERVADAYRVMGQFEDVDVDSIDVEMVDNRLVLNFKLLSASKGIKVII